MSIAQTRCYFVIIFVCVTEAINCVPSKLHVTADWSSKGQAKVLRTLKFCIREFEIEYGVICLDAEPVIRYRFSKEIKEKTIRQPSLVLSPFPEFIRKH